jgi:hypothetical protein
VDFRRLAVAFLLPFLLGAGSLKLYDDDSRTSFTMVEPMDCTILKTSAHGITLGFKFGALFIGVGPEVTFGEREQVKWEEAVQGLMVQYKELCARFNTGALSKARYEARLRELDAAFQKARRELVRGPEERANRLFDMLKEEERARRQE